MRSRKPANAFRDCSKGKAVTLAIAIALFASPAASAQSEVSSPGKNIEAVGVPPIPASLVHEVQPYTSIYGLPLAGWDEAKREIRLKGLSSATWISPLCQRD